ncbi:MAG: hypothetical protein WBM41_06785 [Arenicellales bacterium]
MVYVLAVTWTAKEGHEAEVHEILRMLGWTSFDLADTQKEVHSAASAGITPIVAATENVSA